MIQDNGQGYDKIRNITGFWDVSKYGLRPPPTIFIDNYKYPLSPNPGRVTDNISQVQVKTTNDLDRKEAFIGSMYSQGKSQSIVPRPADSTEPLIKRPNAMKAYLIPVKMPQEIPQDIPINKYHFVYNRDNTEKILKRDIDTQPPTLESFKKRKK